MKSALLVSVSVFVSAFVASAGNYGLFGEALDVAPATWLVGGALVVAGVLIRELAGWVERPVVAKARRRRRVSRPAMELMTQRRSR